MNDIAGLSPDPIGSPSAACEVLARLDDIGNEPRYVGKLSAHDNGMLEVTGFEYPIGYSGRVIATDGREISAEVVGFKGARTLMIPMVQDAPLRSGSRVLPYAKSNQAAVGEALFGRVIGPMGEPIDGKGPILTTETVPLTGQEGNVGLIGERGREVNDFVSRRRQMENSVPTVTIAVPADHSPSSRLKAAYRATAIAEYFRSKGLSVVLVIDSLTRVAHAQREIGLAAGEPPTMKGYPPSALSLIPRLIERAGNDSDTGGSITAIYTVLADGDDLDDPVVDSARAIADGHIILSRSLAEQGVFPAIDIGKSISRVAVDIIEPEHQEAQLHFRRLWSIYEENRDLVLMGAYQAGNDPNIDEALGSWLTLIDYIKQKPRELVDFQLSGLFAS